VAVSAAEVALATGRDLQAGVIGSLRLGVAAGARWSVASELLRRFGRERPGVELTVLEAYGGTLWRDLRAGGLMLWLRRLVMARPISGRSRWAARIGWCSSAPVIR
jgi:DNA-binding transcriptional LysR family regulator